MFRTGDYIPIPTWSVCSPQLLQIHLRAIGGNLINILVIIAGIITGWRLSMQESEGLMPFSTAADGMMMNEVRRKCGNISRFD